MTAVGGSEVETRNIPLVAVVSAVPMLGVALSGSLEGIGEVQSFPAGRRDLAGLLRSLRPDAVVVDTEAEAEAASDYARETATPLVLVSYAEAKLRFFAKGEWSDCDEKGLSPESVRNVLLGPLFGRVGTVRAR